MTFFNPIKHNALLAIVLNLEQKAIYKEAFLYDWNFQLFLTVIGHYLRPIDSTQEHHFRQISSLIFRNHSLSKMRSYVCTKIWKKKKRKKFIEYQNFDVVLPLITVVFLGLFFNLYGNWFFYKVKQIPKLGIFCIN